MAATREEEEVEVVVSVRREAEAAAKGAGMDGIGGEDRGDVGGGGQRRR